MQDFHYKYIKNNHDDKVEILLTYADTYWRYLLVFLKTSTKIKSYPKQSEYYNNSYILIVGKWKVKQVATLQRVL